MKYAIYGETKVQIAEGATLETVKSALSTIYPELSNASVSIDADGNFIFAVATATKGL